MTVADQKILACRPGSQQADELRGVAVGVAPDGQIVTARSDIAALTPQQRTELGHRLADLLVELLNITPEAIH